MLNTADSFYFSNKPTDQERWVNSNDQKNNIQYEGVVQSITPLGYLNGTCTVYIPNLRMYVKCQTNFGYNSFYSGQTVAYKPGDFVRVSFVNGKTERPTIIGSLSNHRSERYMLGEGNPIPKHWTFQEDGASATVTPNAYIPELARWGYRATGQVFDFPGLINQNVQGSNFYTEIPGSAVWDLHGSYHIYPLGELNIAATKLNIKITAPRVDPALFPLEVLQHRMKYFQDFEGKNNRYFLDNTGNKLTRYNLDEHFIPISADMELQPGPDIKKGLIEEAKNEVKSVTHMEKCIDQNRSQAESMFQRIFGAVAGGLLGSFGGGLGNIIDVGDDILNDILNAGLGWAIQQVNGALPDWMQIGLSNGGISVGPIGIDPKTGNISLNGQIFSSFINDGLDSLNKVFPSWLGIKISAETLQIGGQDIPLSELGKDGGSFTVGALVISNQGGSVTVSVDGEVVADITQAVGTMVMQAGTGIINGGLRQLNQNLPAGFQMGASLGSNGMPTFNLGPLKMTPFGPNAGISLDKAALGKALEGLLGGLLEKFLSQLPLPLQLLGRALWNEINFGALFLDAPKEPDGAANSVEGIIRSGRYTCVSGPIDFINVPVTISPLPPPSAFDVEEAGIGNDASNTA
jgi:hypothetical protein